MMTNQITEQEIKLLYRRAALCLAYMDTLREEIATGDDLEWLYKIAERVWEYLLDIRPRLLIAADEHSVFPQNVKMIEYFYNLPQRWQKTEQIILDIYKAWEGDYIERHVLEDIVYILEQDKIGEKLQKVVDRVRQKEQTP